MALGFEPRTACLEVIDIFNRLIICALKIILITFIYSIIHRDYDFTEQVWTGLILYFYTTIHQGIKINI